MRTVVFVLGMGRSGTSALTRLLSLCGATLPKSLLPANSGNPKGYWEPLTAMRINDDFLHSHRSSWYDPGLRLQSRELAAEDREALVARAARFLSDEPIADGGCLIVKEPRITALSPYWRDAAARIGLTPRVIVSHRRPEEVWRSLRARDALRRDHAYLLWLKYCLLAERYSRGDSRVAVGYADVVQHPAEVLGSVIATLALPLRPPATGDIESFLERGLRHHVAAPEIRDDPTPGLWIERCHRLMGGIATSCADAGDFDDIHREFEAWDGSGMRRPWLARGQLRLWQTLRRAPPHRAWRLPLAGEPR